MLGITRDLSIGSHCVKVNHQARLVMGTIRRFCYSTDRQVMVRHLEPVSGLDPPGQEYLAKMLLPYAVKAWDDIRSPEGKLRFEHDHYLKRLAPHPLDPFRALPRRAKICGPIFTGSDDVPADADYILGGLLWTAKQPVIRDGSVARRSTSSPATSCSTTTTSSASTALASTSPGKAV